jgi:DNA repair protein RecN (Recombination protein N)
VALSLALGGRGSADLVRAGHGAAAVEARFRVSPAPLPAATPASAGADDRDRDEGPDAGPPEEADREDLAAWSEDGELILARTIRADGRSSARIGGRIAPVSALASVGAGVVEIHGQHQAEPLLRQATQMAFLDRFAGPDHLATLAQYRSVHGELRRARARLHALDRQEREREREKDLLAYQVRELEAADVQPGELAALAEEVSRLSNAERLQELAAGAEGVLAGEGSGTDAIAGAAAKLAGGAALDGSLSALAARAAALLAEVQDLTAEVRAYRDSAWADPERLAAVQERIHAVRTLERKYGEGEDGILAYLATARARLASLDGAAEERADLASRIGELASRAAELAARVSEGRQRASGPLQDAIQGELHELGMSGARFEANLAAMEAPGPDGAEAVEFRFSGGPRQPLLPFTKVASGGELSRTMLACRSVLADLDDVPTLVFDEVDAGIGGRAAAAVGQRLAGLAASRQVLVVTHLAQIAAHADRQFSVTKQDGVTRIRALDEPGRSAELARMLSGDVSEVSLAHARELMASGAASRGGAGRGIASTDGGRPGA